MRKLLLISSLLLWGPSLYAQSVRYQSQVIGSRGTPLANQNVAVCTQPANTSTTPCSPLATLATSTSTTSGGANPLTTDINGNFFFYAAPGAYTIQIYGPQITTPFVQPDTAVGATGPASLTTLTVSGTGTLASINKTLYVTSAGSDGCAAINTQIAALPTQTINSVAYPVGIVDITGLASNAVVPCGSTVLTKGSPLLWLRGPGRDALVFSCTVNGDCFNAQQGTGFSITPGFKMSGFSVLGQGSSNANAVGIHIGDMVGGSLEDIAVDNFLGTNSSCIWTDNVNGFFESNYWIRVWTGQTNGSQLGCTKNRRFTNTGGALNNASFGHNSFINEQISVANAKTGISIEGGTLFSENWIIDGALVNSATATFLAMSGLAYTGGPNSGLNGNLFFKIECPSGCTGGTLLNLPSGYTVTLHTGEIVDLSGLLTTVSGAGVVQQIQQTLPSGSNIFSLVAQAATSGANFSSPKYSVGGNYWTGSASAGDSYSLQDVIGTGANPTTTWTLLHGGSSGATNIDFSSISDAGLPSVLDIGGSPGTANHFQVKSTNGGVVAGITGSSANFGHAGVNNSAAVDTSGNWGFLGNVFLGGKPLVTSTYTNATTTASNITGLSFAVAANSNYTAICQLYYQGSASTAGLDVTITGPASPTSVFYAYQEAPTGTSIQNSVSSAFGTKLTGNATVTATTNLPATVTIGLRNGANAGTVQVQGSATGAGTVTVQAGSFCSVQ